MKFKDKINSPIIVTFFTLIFITTIQYLLLVFYTGYLGFHPTFIQSGIEISIIFFLNLIGYSITQLYRRKAEKKRFEIILREERERIKEIAYITALGELKNHLFRMNQTQRISETLNEFLVEIFNVEHSTIYLWSDEEGAFLPHPMEGNQNRFAVYDPFMLWLTDNDQVLTLDHFQKAPGYANIKLDAIRILDSVNAETVIPLTLNASLLGVLFLGKKKDGSKMKPEELDRLYEIKSTSVMSLSNAIFYARSTALTENLENKVKERTKALEEAQSQLIMSEKMASLGVMVAGIAHEINTPTGVINGAADNMEVNLHHLILHFPTAIEFFNDVEFAQKYVAILDAILSDNGRDTLDPTERFKKKREIRERLAKGGLSSLLSDDLATFIVEKNFFKIEDQLLDIVKIGGLKILDLLKHTTGINRNLRNIKYAIKNIVRIVRALKYYSHLDQASHAEADLIEGIENTLIIFHNQLKMGITIERDLKPIPLVPCNLDELNQVWTNIIQNAIHAMKGKGILKVSSYLEEPFVCIEIQDSGSGIKPEILDRIWDPFFTTKDQGEGSGLGLGIVKGIIEKHKGKISATSKHGETIFKIQLPYTKVN
jgi:two-component system NtrC family sensor kinase